MDDEQAEIMSSFVEGDRRKVFKRFPQSRVEIAEEYDAKTDALVWRRVREPSTVGGMKSWAIEVGDPSAMGAQRTDALLSEANSQPFLFRLDGPDALQWRIRNLPFPKDVYSVFVDTDTDEIVVRTTNRKYYKRILVPDLRRLGVRLEDDALSWSWGMNTLLISYRKPARLVAYERREKERMKKQDALS